MNDRYKNYGLLYAMSYTLTQYQTTPMISRDYVSTFELGPFYANKIGLNHIYYIIININNIII
jgi:hypothetical protein